MEHFLPDENFSVEKLKLCELLELFEKSRKEMGNVRQVFL